MINLKNNIKNKFLESLLKETVAVYFCVCDKYSVFVEILKK